MASKRRRRSPAFTVLGLVLIPTAVAAALAAAHTLFSLAASVTYFSAGFGAVLFAHMVGVLRGERAYVFAHELTHAAAAWFQGGKVLAFVVKADSGHVDLSKMNAFIALAPYWIPLYALATVGVYRLAIWSGPWPKQEEFFLAAMGGALAFHFAHTARALWSTHQSDLDHLGITLSLSLIALLNAGVLLGALKCLFPQAVSVSNSLRWVMSVTKTFWGALASGVGDVLRATAT
ncbi:MAG: hypothetical protein COB53_02220 [Elusimicrobia bacterium]|nr:MAG: hypothetical protein COB53_02220 [Elusimicrobiota bacterium]